jgi:hypothetical protein
MTDASAPARPRARAWLWPALTGLGAIVQSVLTGPDGRSWAPGRIMGFGVFGVGQCLVVRASASVLAHGLDPEAWKTFFDGVAGFEFADCTVAIGLVLGMAPTDPGGRWWSKDASPPPGA